MSNNPESLVERMHQVADEAYPELERYLPNARHVVELGRHGRIDYISVYTTDDSEYGSLSQQASETGNEIFDKGGLMYILATDESPVNVVRICRPKITNTRFGGIDFVFDDFPRVQDEVTSRAPDTKIHGKSFPANEEGGVPEDYSLLQIINPSSNVSISFLNRSIVDIICKSRHD